MFSLGAVAPLKGSLLSEWLADLGVGSTEPGITVVGLKYSLSISTAAIQTTSLAWGAIIIPRMITTFADLSPKTHQHLDWFEWGARVISTPATTAVQVVGGGDDGFRSVHSKRRVREIEDDAVFVVESDQACTVNLQASTAVMLP